MCNKILEERDRLWCIALLRTLKIDEVDAVLKEFIVLRNKRLTTDQLMQREEDHDRISDSQG